MGTALQHANRVFVERLRSDHAPRADGFRQRIDFATGDFKQPLAIGTARCLTYADAISNNTGDRQNNQSEPDAYRWRLHCDVLGSKLSLNASLGRDLILQTASGNAARPALESRLRVPPAPAEPVRELGRHRRGGGRPSRDA